MGLIFDIQAAVVIVVVHLVRARIALFAPGGSFRRQRTDVQALAEQVNALQ